MRISGTDSNTHPIFPRIQISYILFYHLERYSGFIISTFKFLFSSYRILGFRIIHSHIRRFAGNKNLGFAQSIHPLVQTFRIDFLLCIFNRIFDLQIILFATGQCDFIYIHTSIRYNGIIQSGQTILFQIHDFRFGSVKCAFFQSNPIFPSKNFRIQKSAIGFPPKESGLGIGVSRLFPT